jgi:enediyne biosynthesis protein E4
MSNANHPDPERLPETNATADQAALADRRIGRAVGVSIGFLALVGVIVAVGWWLTRPKPDVVTPVDPVAAPTGPKALPPGAVIAIPFAETAPSMGISFQRVNGATGEKLLPETMGGGVAMADFDGDGNQDVLFINGNHWPWIERKAAIPPSAHLYVNRNRGEFVEATNRSGIDVPMQGMGVAIADYDGDGKPDVFISAVGQDRLFRNVTELLGVPRFEEVTDKAIPKESQWGTSAGFFDFDRDGDLDLFVCNYVEWSPDIDRKVAFTLTGIGRAYGPPTGFAGADSFLWRNEGDGTFKDVSAEAGIQVRNAATGKPVGKSLGVTFVDVDRDGFLEILVANDGVVNFLFRNKGDGTFEEVGGRSGFAFDRAGNARGAMGIDASWYREDGRLGVAIGNFANEMSALYVSRQGDEQKSIRFADDAILEGIGPATRRVLTFGVLMIDVDLDGWDDLLQCNGHIEEDISRTYQSQRYRQPGQLFRNIAGIAPDGPAFCEIPGRTAGDFTNEMVGRGMAYADIDGDGDLDLMVTQPSGPVYFLRNDQATRNHWVRLQLVGWGKNRDAVGAEIDLVADGRARRKQVMPTRSYLSSCEKIVTFGLGAATSIDTIRIRWPDGSMQMVDPTTVRLDRLTVIEQPASE